MKGTLGFIGAGNMGEALIRGIVSKGRCNPKEIFVYDVSTERMKGLEGYRDQHCIFRRGACKKGGHCFTRSQAK